MLLAIVSLLADALPLALVASPNFTGPVVDVEFPRGSIPELFNALHADIPFESLKKTLTLEVAQHLGDNLVRTISLQPTDGLVRGTEVTDTGNPISVPVGEKVKGHVFNALGY